MFAAVNDSSISSLHLTAALVDAVIIIATRSILDIPTVMIAIATIFTLLYVKKLQELYIILFAAILGIIIKLIL